MKKLVNNSIVFAMAISMIIGCRKKSNQKIYPDTSNFSAVAQSSYVAGNRGAIVVNSTTLTDGNYMVKYTYRTLTDTVNSSGQYAALTMKNHTGSFQTLILSDPLNPVIYVTLDSITNASGNATYLAVNNFVTLQDSTGAINVMSAGTNSFTAVYTHADTSSSNLDIFGLYYLPGKTDHKEIDFVLANAHNIGTYSFNNFFFGGRSYIMTYTGSTNKMDSARYGTVTVSATSPVYTGTFSITLNDSTKVTGSFSAPVQ